MKQTVSLIVPIYNVAPWLNRCLDSILAQTRGDFQLILVDDGSTDACSAICDEYAAKDSRIQVIHKENGGLSSARNAGLEVADGEYICFIDSDDWLHPQYLELMLHFQRSGDYDLVICNHERTAVPVAGTICEPHRIVPRELDLEGIYRQHRIKSYVWNKLYRRELIGDHRFIQQKIAEDAAFNGIVLGNWEHVRACYIPQVLYYYFYREGSLVTQLDAAHRLALAEVFSGYAKDNPSLRVRRIYARELLKTALAARYRYHICGFDSENRTKCRSLLKEGLTLLWKTPFAPLGERLAYTGLCLFPQAYRLMRIRDDRTLLAWEKQQHASSGGKSS